MVRIGFAEDHREPGTFMVSAVLANVIGQRLTMDQGNQAVMDFYGEHIRPFEGPGLDAAPPRAEQDLSEYMDAEGINLLRSFSDLANKGTGAGHPLDAERWHAFIFHAHATNVEISGDLFMSALIDDFGWHEKGADNLHSQYLAFREILQEYDEWRQGRE